MKFLVTGESKHFFKLENNQVLRHEFQDFTYYNLFPEVPGSLKFHLPGEITLMILEHLFDIYLKNRSFECAYRLLAIHPNVTKYLYTLIFGKFGKANSLMLLSRIAKTFYICELIDDYLLTDNNGVNNCLRLIRFGANYRPIRPWQFTYDTTIEMLYANLSNSTRLLSFITGPNNADVVWVNGNESDGILNVKEMYHPVITLILSDIMSIIVPCLETIKTSDYFRHFGILIKKVYGPGTRLNIMVNSSDEVNPFNTTSDTFAVL